MPLQDHMQLISTDDHLIEPANLWTDRLPRRFIEPGPRIIEKVMNDPNRPAHVWTMEGKIYPYIGLNAVAGKKPEEFGAEPVRFDDMLPGCYDPKARVIDMDIDGVQAALSFPSFPKFAGTIFLQAQDRELALLCVQAWNDYVLDEWCPTAPDRFIPLSILPLWDADLCVQEIHRVAAKGAKAISFPENPVPLGLPSFHTDHWDGVFSACEETGLPLCVHFGTSGKPPITAEEAPMAVMIALFGCNSMYATADLLFSPVFHRHPKLKFALSEGGIGWVPYMLERIDATWEKHRFYQNVNQTVRPSDLFRKHMYGCFIEDDHGIANRHLVGIDNITWECDYPHSDSNWPNSRKVVTEAMLDVPDEDVEKMVETNARKLFDFPRLGA
ncbi:amidohydrolase family protein [Gordonia alkanivorans]|uniref:Amidohydrolase n=1 Tax=Gordonia alkanivorans CGMCC 6845 TaxID=1423140 RepID=W9DE08_9ACTN|nr:amidohydrolase family protein [Gordonia alkanivorans]ETA04651.1 amidohydrolase [Gordonia alkanivorans CGMCC 6845]MDH3008759.1 amidohydrolase family protein [Gordonia alkanivorans]MDH3012626.1 amidohydrolase family protein [Gordonia alkanivorans]MDH3022022.1 amidohydrolase family protein [Gordonia alkanivorans]MDH3043042.1 amidohydrolase family protein [Gordonia alkanivorans]